MKFMLPLLLLLLVRCTVGPDFVRPAPPVALLSNDGASAGPDVQAQWWRLFAAPELEVVVAKALKNNLTLQAAQATLRQSQSLLNAGNGVFYPQVNLGVDASREKSSPRSFGVNAPSSVFNLFTASGNISYALDVFGGERRAVEGLKAQVDYQKFAVLAAYLTLTGNVVNTVVARATAQAEILATQEIIELGKTEVALAEVQVRAGTAPFSNVLSLRAQLSANESALSPLRQKQDQADHLLAVLSGQIPSEFSPPGLLFSELTLPQNLPKTIRSQLLERRPDILQSEAQLRVASAAVGVTTAALFPSFALTSTYGFNNTSTGNLFKSESNFWSLAGSLTAPVFRGGSLRSERQAALEAFQASLSVYHQTVLLGVAQVADTLRGLEHDAEQAQAQAQALAAADEAAKLIGVSYRAGIASYLQLMTANMQLLQAKIGVIQVKAQSLQDTVALFIALGGGWWNGGGNSPGLQNAVQ